MRKRTGIRQVLTIAAAVGLLLATVLTGWADELGKVKKSGALRFAMSGQYPPFNFVDDQNHLTGFDVEIGNEIAKRVGVKGEAIATAWDGIIAGLLGNKYDLICGSMAITAERLKAIDFSDPYYRSGAQLFVGKDSNILSVEDLKGKKVGVTLGTTYEAWIRKNIEGVEVRTYKGDPDIILEIGNGRVAGIITDKLVGALAIKEKNAPIKLVGNLLYEEKMGIALRQKNPKLKAAINTALADMKKDGTYKRISMKWFGIDVR